LNALSSLAARLELAGDHISAGVVYPVAKPMSLFSLFIGSEPGIDQHPVPLVVLQIIERPSVPVGSAIRPATTMVLRVCFFSSLSREGYRPSLSSPGKAASGSRGSGAATSSAPRP
jgi:hypothetical protein